MADLDGDGVPEPLAGEIDALGQPWDAVAYAANAWTLGHVRGDAVGSASRRADADASPFRRPQPPPARGLGGAPLGRRRLGRRRLGSRHLGRPALGRPSLGVGVVAMTTAVANRMPAPARVLIAAVVLGGAVALAVAISWMIPMDEPHAFALLLIAGAVGLGAQLVLTFPHAGELEHFSLEESVWIAALVLAPRGVATVGAVAGTVAWQYFRRTETHKIAFNAGQVAIAVLTAELTYGLIERRDPTDPVAWLMAAVALAICSLINAGTVSLVISLVAGRAVHARSCSGRGA